MGHRQHSSRTFRVIAKTWYSFPVWYLAFSILVLGVNFAGLFRLLLSPGYWFVSMIAIIAGFGIQKIRWFTWYAFLFSNFTIAYLNAVSLVYHSVAELRFQILAFVLSCLAQVGLIFLVTREIRVPYFFPRIRWWESDPRYKLSVQAKINRKESAAVEGEIMDLSLGGCFVKTHNYFVHGEEINLEFLLFEKIAHCKGHVVWATESTVTHPKGIGIKFFGLDKETVSALRQATKKLKELTRHYNQMSRERNWQEYLQREKSYQGGTANEPSGEE